MDSDVTADSLSPPENRIATTSERRFGSDALSSFSTLGPQDHGGSSERSCPPLDSFDLSTATDASPGDIGGFLDESRQQMSQGEAGGLTPLSRRTRGSDGPHVEQGSEDNRHDDDVRIRRNMSFGLPQAGSIDFEVGGEVPAAAFSSGNAHRKRSREDAMTDGYGRGWQPQPRNRLESSWPLSRHAVPSRRSRSSTGGGSPLGQSHVSPSPPLSRQGTIDGSPHGRYEPPVPRSAFGGGGRESTDGGGEGCYASRSEHDNSGSAGDSISIGGGGMHNRMGGILRTSGNDISWNGSNSENLSISEESSRGLPAPPVVASGPLPAIGALREHFLTQKQQHCLDRERRLAADHMRRINQVLAGHLSFAEVARVHQHRDSFDALSAAPSHGSTVHDSPRESPLDDGDDEKINKERLSARQAALRHLVLRVARDRTRNALAWAWIRFWRHPSRGHTSSIAGVTAPSFGETPGGLERVEDRFGHQRESDVQDRQRQASKLVYRICRDRNRRCLFRGWNRLCQHAASAARPVTSIKAETAVADENKSLKNDPEVSAKILREVGDDPHGRAERSSLERRGKVVKHLVTRIHDAENRRLRYRGWSRLLLHAATISAVEADRATITATTSVTAAAVGKIQREQADRSGTEVATAASASDRAPRQASKPSEEEIELRARAEEAERVRQGNANRSISRLVHRACKDRDRRLLLRAWNRLCLHAASRNATKAQSAKDTSVAKAAMSKGEENEGTAATTTVNAPPGDVVLQERKEAVVRRAREQRQKHAVQLIAYLCRDSDRRFLFRGWNRLCLHAASLRRAEEAFPAAASAAAAAAAAWAVRADDTDSEATIDVDESEASKQAVAAAKVAGMTTTTPTERSLHQATKVSEVGQELPPSVEEEERARRDRRNRVLGRVAGRRKGEQERRYLFRGWNRLYLHAATLAAAEKASALVATTGIASRVSAASALHPAANPEAEGSGWETNSERDGREAENKNRSSGHRLREQRIIHGSRKIDQILQDKDRRSLTQGWSRLLLHIPSQSSLEPVSTTTMAATRPDKTSGQEENIPVTPSSADLITSVAAIRQRAQLAEREARGHQEKLALHMIVRVCSERDKRSMFRSWNRLCLHAASSKDDDTTGNVDTATSQVTTADHIGRGEAAAVQQGDDATEIVSEGSVGAVKLLERAHEAERALDEQKRRQRGRLIARILGGRDKRRISRGWHRLCLHATRASAAERIAAATSIAAATFRADVTEEKPEAAVGKVGASNSAVAGAATATKGALGTGAGSDNAATATRVRADKAEEALRRQGGRLIARILEGSNRRRCARGWSRLYLHNPSPNALEGSSASATVAARSIRAEAVDNKEPVAAEENETRPRAKNTGIAKKGSVAAREEAKRAVARASVLAAALKRREDELEQLVRAQHKHRAIMVITRACRDRDRPLLALGWSRLCLRAVEDVSTGGVAVAAPNRGQAGEAAVVTKNSEDVGLKAAPTAANRQAQEEAASNSSWTVNRRQKHDTEKVEVREQQERRTKRLIERLCSDKERVLLFRGWSRLCMHAAAAARAPLVDAKKTDELSNDPKPEMCRTGVGTSMDAVAATETVQQENTETSKLATKLKNKDDELQHLLREQHLQRIIRARHDRDRSLIFRGWSRLCLHTWSLKAAAGASAAATSSSVGGPRPRSMEGEENFAVSEVNPSQKGVATSGALDAVQAAKGGRHRDEPGIQRAVAEHYQIAEKSKQEVQRQQKRRATKTIARISRDRDRALLFRGWSRLCLHAASLPVAEGASAAATAAARAARAEAMVREATAAAEKADAWKRAAAASAGVAAAREQAARETAEASTSAAERERQEGATGHGLRHEQERRAKTLIARIGRDKDRALVFRGWSRLCLHAASISAAEGASAAATAAARAARAKAMEMEATAAAEKAKTLRRTAVDSADEAASRGQEQREEFGALTLTTELERREEAICEVLQKQRERRAKMLIVRVGRERDRALVFRGWSRLCLHAASLSAAEGASAAATAAARTARAEAMEMEATAAAMKAEACQANTDVAASREQAKREGAELEGREEPMDHVLQEQRRRRAKMLIARVGRDRDRTLVFRGWSRLCLHAASLSVAEGGWAAATAAARAARAEAMEMEATAAAKKAGACIASASVAASKKQTKREAAELEQREETVDQVLQEQRERRAKMMITRVGRDRDRALVFRGWTRLCLHAASLSASEGASAAVTAAARAARAEAVEMEATAAAKTTEACYANADAAASREQAKRVATGASTSAAELVGWEEAMGQVEQKQRKRRAKMLIARIDRDRDKALLFRGWSRLCLHAASLSAAEGASAAATAAARASRARAMDTEATAAAEKAEASRRAAAVSAEVAASREQAQKDTAEQEQWRGEAMEQVDRQRQERHAKTLIARVGRDRDRALMFRGWSRLCLHTASLSAAEGASAAATAAARIARTDAVEAEATAAAEKAEAMKRAAAASPDMAASREQAQRGATELVRREKATAQALRQQRERLAKTLIARIGRNRDKVLMFRGWSRLCLHAASLSAAEGASAAATAVARAARAEAMETEATAAAEKAEAMKRAAATSSAAVTSNEQVQRGATELARREEVTDQVLRQQRERRAKALITRIARDKDRTLMFRGWSRLCMHAASLSAAEGASASAIAAARVARAEAVEMEATAAAKKAEAMKRAAAASADEAESKEQAQRGAVELVRQEEATNQALQRQRERLATTLIVHVGRDRDRALLFRGWSRLCLHAASLSAAEGASAAATAAARAARAKAMESEANAAAEKAEVLKRVAAASAEVAASREQAERGAIKLAQREEATGQALQQQHERRAKTLITRIGRDGDRALMFRGWSRLCLHAASLSAAEGASAAATAAARVARAEAMETEANAAAEKAEAFKRAADISVEVAASKEQAQRGATELAQREEATRQVLRQQHERLAKILIARIGRDRDRALMFRGWSRLCLHAASLSAAEGASAAATAAARAARAEAMETEATAAAEKAEAWKRAAAASANVAASREQAQRDTAEREQRGETMYQVLRRQQKRGAKTLIARIGRDRDRVLLFRGWSRLCQHAASLSTAEGASAAATAAARAARAEAVETEATAASEKAETWKRAAAASADVAASREKAQREATELTRREEAMGQVDRQQRERLAKMLISRVSRDRDRVLLFRGWSRLCLHAASRSAAEGASASATVAARAVRAEAMETKATAAAEKVEAWKRAAAASANVAVQGRETMGQGDRQQRERRAKMLIARVGRDRNRTLMFRGWSRLCLHAASLSAAEEASVVATVTARAARAEAIETESAIAAEKTETWKGAAAASAEMEAPKEKKKLQAAELARREEAMNQQDQQERQRRAKLLIVRVGRDRDRALMFRGWSRLCLHAASLSAAEGALAATTAAARAVRAEAMETEATAAAEKAEAWKRAAAASVEVAALREQAHREAAELEQREDAMIQVGRQQQKRRAKMLIARVGRDRDRALVLRGWSRLCLHPASLSAADGTSASATAAARAARAEAMEREATAAAEKAEAWKRAAVASADVASSREQEQRKVAELARREEAVGEVDQQHRERRAKIVIARVGRDTDRALMFRGWNRLCLHAATAAARDVRVKAMETEATAAAEKAEALKRVAAASADMAASREQAQREATQLARREGVMDQMDRQQRERRAKTLITRVGRDRDRALMFRGWSRLCLHAASLSAAEGASGAATAAARASRAEAMETEATSAAEKTEAWKRAAAASAGVAAEKEQAELEAVELAQREEDMGQVDRQQQERRAKTLIARVSRDRDRALMFRGWSRLCLHAASLSAAEGASAAATAAARAARAEAMELEATAVAEKAEAHRVSEGMAASTEQAQRGSELEGREDTIDQVLREHREHRAKMLIFRVSGDRRKARLFRGWSRLRLHAASLSAAERPLPIVTTSTKAVEAEATEGAATSATHGALENTDGDFTRRRTRAAVMVQRLTADRNRQVMRRAWRLLCQHTASNEGAATTAASSAAVETAASEVNIDDGDPLPPSDSVSRMNAAGSNGRHCQQQLRKMVLRHSLRVDRRMIARGWARLTAAAAASASTVAVTEGTKKIASLKAYAVDLQQQAVRRRRELERKTRALDILLRDDWANAVLQRVSETRAARLQLARAEADRDAQVDAMAGLTVDEQEAGTENAPGAVRGQDNGGVGTGTTGEREDDISVGGSEGGIEMVALQEDGARQLRRYLGAKDRDLKRARVETQLWRTRCGEMQRRLKITATSSDAWPSTSAAERDGLPAVLHHMLDEKDRRLTQLRRDLASLAIACDKGSGRAHAKRQAGEFLLRQISAAGEEARTYILRLSHEVQFLETELADLRTLNSGQQPFDAVPSYSANGGSHGVDGLEETSLQFPPRDAGLLDDEVANMATTSPSIKFYPTVSLDEGVQAAIDAHLLVCSLRSEVSALECHRAALEAKLWRLEDISASTFDETAAAAAAAATTAAAATATAITAIAAAIPTTATTQSGSIVAPADGAAENAEMPASSGAPPPPMTAPSEKARRRAARAERRKQAAAFLRQAFLHRHEPVNPMQAHVPAVAEEFRAADATLSSIAARAEHTQEARRRAQEAFVSTRVNEVERGLEGSPRGP